MGCRFAGTSVPGAVPLLGEYLAGLPKAARLEPRARLDPVPANFEFSAFLAPHQLDSFRAGAAARQLTVWTNAEEGGLRVFGAGMVEATAHDSVTT